jgi:uncharacterized protein YndB with AHSA1/START domain
MELTTLTATARIMINAPVDKTWKALIDPAMIKEYMFGTTVISDWTEGSDIIWTGEWKGQHYEDKGQILSIIPDKQLRYTHYSPLSGLADSPENYHTVNIDLKEHEHSEKTELILTQDNNPSEEQKKHSEENWMVVLKGLKKLLEQTT